ncbi:MAG: hypothetical protein ABI353_16895 [Isosphaeraceae bacterium]
MTDLDDGDQPGWKFSTTPRVRFGAIGDAWELLLKHLGTWILTVILLILCQGAINAVFGPSFVSIRGGRPALHAVKLAPGQLFQSILSIAVNGFFLGGMVRMAAKQIRGLPIRALDLFEVVDVLPQLLLASFLVSLATLVGLSICIVPGLILAGLLMFTIPLVVDGRMEATAAFGQSIRALQGQWLSATFFHMVAGLAAVLGFLLCGVGVVVTAPLYALSITVLYRDFFWRK